MMVLSIDTKNNTAFYAEHPRDLWVSILARAMASQLDL